MDNESQIVVIVGMVILMIYSVVIYRVGESAGHESCVRQWDMAHTVPAAEPKAKP